VKQLTLLARGLPRDRFEPRVCVLGDDGPAGAVLRGAGVLVETLGWSRPFDPGALWRLRRRVQTFRPDVIHAWRPRSLRAVALAAGRGSRLVVSEPCLPEGPPGRLDRWLLRRAPRVVAAGQAEARRCQDLGLPPGKVVVVPPGVETAPVRRDIDPTQRLLACAGPLEPHKGFQDAIWTFDILQQVYDDLHLLVIGTGPERPQLEKFARNIGGEGRVHFAGDRADAAALLAGADVVWVPSRAAGGINVALEGMAAGRPVVAARLPGLAEIVADGETGFLVPPGDKVALGRQTRLLLDDAGRRRRMGEAGRQHAADRFPAGALVRRWAAVYDDGAATEDDPMTGWRGDRFHPVIPSSRHRVIFTSPHATS